MTGPIGIVSGSGIELESLIDSVDQILPFTAFPGLAQGSVVGHTHRFIIGRSGQRDVIVQCGRLHMYEGFDYEQVTRPVDVLRDLGAKTIFFTNAAGGLSPVLQPGDILGVNAVRLCRYQRWEATPGVFHPDFVVDQADYHGALQWVPGPSYETRAEIRALQQMRVMAVGMSVGPELARCQDLGIQAAVLSCITNACFSGERLTHEQVVTNACRASQKIADLIRHYLAV